VTVIVIVFVSGLSLSNLRGKLLWRKTEESENKCGGGISEFRTKNNMDKIAENQTTSPKFMARKAQEKKNSKFHLFFCFIQGFISELPEFENVYRTVPVATMQFQLLHTLLLLVTATCAMNISSPSPSIISRVKQHHFGMYSYFFTQSTSAIQEIAAFSEKYEISNIVQYACLGVPPAHFANFVDIVYTTSGTTTTVLFDRTKWYEDSSPYSIVAKFQWYKDVKNLLSTKTSALAGVSFDIEDLSSEHYLSLFAYAKKQWEMLGLTVYGEVGFNLGATHSEGVTAAKAITNNVVDNIYWENYRNTEADFFDFADDVLQQVTPNNRSTMILAVNTICCSNPCVAQDTCSGAKCLVPGTHVFQLRSTRSFCRENDIPNEKAKMSTEYMLDTLDRVRASLYKKYPNVLNKKPFYVYDYRSFKIFLEGTDAVHATTCPAPYL
jgi:hypothetical protein